MASAQIKRLPETPTALRLWRPNEPKRRGEAGSLAKEAPMEIRIRGRSFGVVMRTPGHDRELVTGLLWSEGIIRTFHDLVDIAPCQAAEAHGEVVNAYLASSVRIDWKTQGRGMVMGTSCGLCGALAIESVRKHFPPLSSREAISVNLLAQLPERMRPRQKLFSQTGAVHAAALFTLKGKCLVVREDVGRHNAVDKVLGWAFWRRWLPLENHVLLVSGRVSFEIMQKALAAGLPVVAAVSAPTDLAVEFAMNSGQTLAGFVRGGKVTVYSHAARVVPNTLHATEPSSL